MKKILFLGIALLLFKTGFSQTFALPGDGNWYLVATVSGMHSHFEYIYYQNTANNPSICSGEIDFINSRNTMIQHHTTMGYNAWNQPQFALVNYGDSSQVWAKATTGVDAGNFTVTNHLNGAINNGSINRSDLSATGGTVTIYDKLKDDAETHYANIIIPSGYLSVGIDTVNTDYRLAVNGTIHTQEVKVDLDGWSDYVFKPTYKLPSLSAVKGYIDINHHLPDMPSDQEIVKNGLKLGSMEKTLTKKVEELTLYLLEKDQQIADQQKELAEQKKTDQSLQTQLDQMKRQLNALTTKKTITPKR